MKTEKKTIQSRQKYTIEVIHYTDGSSHLNRFNNGFSVIEMIGLLSVALKNLHDVYEGAFMPKVDTINRKSKNSPIIHKPWKPS
jgi:hypothetical protein